MSFGSLPSVLGNGGGVAISVIGGTGLFADGTAAAPSISFASDSDTGFYRNASGQMGFSANGALSLWFATGGRLYGASVEGYTEMPSGGGVNLVAAGSNKNITLTPSGTGYLSVANGNAGAGYAAIIKGSATYGLGVYMGNGGTDVSLWSVTNSPLIFGTNEAERMRLFANGRLGIGTGATDSGALLQVGANGATGAALAGMSFGGDTFLSRGITGQLIQSGVTPVFSLVPTTPTQTGFFTVVNSGGTTYIGCDNSTGGNFGAGAYTAIFGSGSAATAIVSLGIKAVVFDTSQNATFAARSSATTAYGTAKSVTVDFGTSTATNVTRTFTVTMPSPGLVGTFLLEVGVYGNGATGTGSLLVKGYGYLADSTLYGGTEISKVVTGTVTISSITKANGSFTFTVLNTANAAYVAVKYSQTSEAAITTLPTITSA